MFLCCMDLTKAFDNVKLSILFHKLKDKVPPIIIRILIYSYIHQECFISWSGVKSSVFSIKNGVRQGAVLSPTLFNIYILMIYKRNLIILGLDAGLRICMLGVMHMLMIYH